MSSSKCPNCGLVNFTTAQFCKRCNLSLDQYPPANRIQNDTQILDSAGNTHIRQPLPVQQNQPLNNNAPFFQNNQQNYNQGQAGQNNYGQGYQNNQNYQQPYQGHQYQQPFQQQPFQQQPFQQPYQGNPYQPQSYQQQSNAWSLPQFPKGQRPPQYNSYQTPSHYRTNEMAFRRFGPEVALHKNSTLPEICIKCGTHIGSYNDGGYVTQKYRWHHPAVYAALVSPLIYLILAACLSERFSINVPLCREHIEKRETLKTYLIIGGIVSAVLLGLFVNAGWFGLAFVTFMVSIITIGLNFEYGYKPVRVKKIEGSYYHLTGASNEFLNTLPY